MGNYGGFFLKGLASGISTGLDVSQKIQEMKWQKKQKKLLKEQQQQFLETANLWNSSINEFLQDKELTEEETIKLSTIYLTGGYEFMSHYQGAMEAVWNLNSKKLDEEIQWMKNFNDIAPSLTSSADIDQLYDYFSKFVTTEKNKTLFEASYQMLKKQKEELELQMSTPSNGLYSSYEDAVKVAQQFGGEVTIKYDKEADAYYLEGKMGGVEGSDDTKKAQIMTSIYNSGNETLYNTYAQLWGLPSYKETEKKLTALEEKVNLAKQYGATNQDILNNIILGKSGNEGQPANETVYTLMKWEDYFNPSNEDSPKSEEDFNRLMELLKLSGDNYVPPYSSYKEYLVSEIKGLSQDLEHTKQLMSDPTVDNDAKKELKQAYNEGVKTYKQKLEELQSKYPDVDISQFPDFEEMRNWLEKAKEWGKSLLGGGE